MTERRRGIESAVARLRAEVTDTDIQMLKERPHELSVEEIIDKGGKILELTGWQGDLSSLTSNILHFFILMRIRMQETETPASVIPEQLSNFYDVLIRATNGFKASVEMLAQNAGAQSPQFTENCGVALTGRRLRVYSHRTAQQESAEAARYDIQPGAGFSRYELHIVRSDPAAANMEQIIAGYRRGFSSTMLHLRRVQDQDLRYCEGGIVQFYQGPTGQQPRFYPPPVDIFKIATDASNR